MESKATMRKEYIPSTDKTFKVCEFDKSQLTLNLDRYETKYGMRRKVIPVYEGRTQPIFRNNLVKRVGKVGVHIDAKTGKINYTGRVSFTGETQEEKDLAFADYKSTDELQREFVRRVYEHELQFVDENEGNVIMLKDSKGQEYQDEPLFPDLVKKVKAKKKKYYDFEAFEDIVARYSVSGADEEKNYPPSRTSKLWRCSNNKIGTTFFSKRKFNGNGEQVKTRTYQNIIYDKENNNEIISHSETLNDNYKQVNATLDEAFGWGCYGKDCFRLRCSIMENTLYISTDIIQFQVVRLAPQYNRSGKNNAFSDSEASDSEQEEQKETKNDVETVSENTQNLNINDD